MEELVLALLRSRRPEPVMNAKVYVFLSFIAVGFVLAIILTPITYFIVKSIVVRHRAKANGTVAS